MSDEPLYTVEEVAERLRISEGTVTKAIKAGRLAALQVEKQYRIPESAVAAWAKPTRPSEGSEG